MRFKLDENLGSRGADILRNAGRDVMTVWHQGLDSASDPDLIAHCQEERRCLVTLDRGFSNAVLFPPEQYAGIAVLRLPANPELDDILERFQTLRRALAKRSLDRRLWIVEANRIREHQTEGSD